MDGHLAIGYADPGNVVAIKAGLRLGHRDGIVIPLGFAIREDQGRTDGSAPSTCV
jgi:hypothetical protein